VLKYLSVISTYLLNTTCQPRHGTFQFSHSIQITTANLDTSVIQPERWKRKRRIKCKKYVTTHNW